ncbi:hypothetical protein KJY77_00705 [Canibacter sp. lx-72]|nr:hypothetical protein [Canibacter zhuwentaonis]MBT1017667.1 hypothetical protein [Canibacter zhuwentaonis]
MRLFDKLTGVQLLYCVGVLHVLDRETVRRRTSELAEAFVLGFALTGLFSTILRECRKNHARLRDD